MTDKRIGQANIRVGDRWGEFTKKCAMNGSNASQEIRRFINAYLDGNETKQMNMPDSWLEDRTRQLVREELPATLQVFEKKISNSLALQIEQLESKMARFDRLDQNDTEPAEGQDSSFNINVNSQIEPSNHDNSISENIDISTDEKPHFEKPKKIDDLTTDKSSERAIVKESEELNSDKKESPRTTLNNRELGRLIGRNSGSISRWRKAWDNLPDDHVVKRSGYKPNNRGSWDKIEADPKWSKQKDIEYIDCEDLVNIFKRGAELDAEE